MKYKLPLFIQLVLFFILVFTVQVFASDYRMYDIDSANTVTITDLSKHYYIYNDNLEPQREEVYEKICDNIVNGAKEITLSQKELEILNFSTDYNQATESIISLRNDLRNHCNFFYSNNIFNCMKSAECRSDNSETLTSITIFCDNAKYKQDYEYAKTLLNTLTNLGITNGTVKQDAVKTISNYLMDNLEYPPNSDDIIGFDHYRNSLTDKRAICIDYSTLFKVLNNLCSINTVIIEGYGSNGIFHCWNRSFLNNNYLYSDITYQDIARAGYFLISENEINQSHTPNNNIY